MRNNDPITNGATKVTAAAAAAATSVIGIVLMVSLLSLKLIGETVFAGLFTISLLSGLFIAFSNRIEFFSLKELSIKLAQVEDTKRDVIAREEHIREMALILGEITLFTSVTSGILFSPETRETRRLWLESKVKELMSLISALPDEKDEVFKYLAQFNETYTKGQFDKEKSSIGWEKFWSMAVADINKK